MGYLLRLVGSALEIKLFSGLSGILCLLGCLTAFGVTTPSRLLHHQYKQLNENSQNQTPLLNDEMISVLSQTIEAYYIQDHEYILESFLLLFSIEANDFDHPGKRFKEVVRTSWPLWIFSLLALTVTFDCDFSIIQTFPSMIISEALPLLLRHVLPAISDSFYSDVAISFAILLVMTALFCAATKGHGQNLLHFSLWVLTFCLLIATAMSVFDYTSISSPLVSTLKAVFLLLAQVLFFSLCLPLIAVYLIGTFPIFTRERYLGIAVACIYVLTILNYPLNTLINQVVKSSTVSYAFPGIVFLLYSCLFRRIQSKGPSTEVIDKCIENPLCTVY